MPDCDPKIINRMKHVPNEGLCAVQSRNNGGGGDFGRGIVLVLKVCICVFSRNHLYLSSQTKYQYMPMLSLQCPKGHERNNSFCTIENTKVNCKISWKISLPITIGLHDLTQNMDSSFIKNYPNNFIFFFVLRSELDFGQF